MVVAMMYPEAKAKAGRGKSGRELDHFPMVSKDSLSRARKVLKFAGDLADGVLSGLSLEKAYLEAREREQMAQGDEVKLATRVVSRF
jgi:hypothetical protein